MQFFQSKKRKQQTCSASSLAPSRAEDGHSSTQTYSQQSSSLSNVDRNGMERIYHAISRPSSERNDSARIRIKARNKANTQDKDNHEVVIRAEEERLSFGLKTIEKSKPVRRHHNGRHSVSTTSRRSVNHSPELRERISSAALEETSKRLHSSLTRPDKLLFSKYSRHFQDPMLEAQYQLYTSENWFNRARWHVLALISLHLLLNLLFILLENSGVDQFRADYGNPQEWIQFIYLFFAIPFGCIPRKFSPFRKSWKMWVCVIMILFNIGFQFWIAFVSQTSKDLVGNRVQDKLVCENDSIGTANGNHIIQELLEGYFATLVETLIGFCGMFSCIYVVSIRLEFVQVAIITAVAILTYVLIVDIYINQVDYMPTVCYAFAVSLVCSVSYSSDVRNRRSFLIKFQVDKENETLKTSLDQAEAALMNEPACDAEKEAVQRVLENAETKHLEMFRIPFSDLKFLRAIGRGGMGDVIKAKYFGTVVVCKRMRRENISDETCIKHFREEIELMSCLRHPNIVQFIGASWDNCSNLCIVMEYLENGDMHSVLHSSIGKNFTWSDPFLKMAIDVVQGMVYLHSQEPPVVHRDLKSVNILCSATYGCKVGDFGLSRRYNKDIDALTTLVGTPFWLAPEIIRNEPYGTEADVYSFGIVLTELETRHTPYHDHPDTGLKVLMRVANNNLRPTLPSTCLKQRRLLIEDCLLDNPCKRPTFAQVLARLQGPVREEIEGDAEKSTFERRAILKKQNEQKRIN